MIIAMSDTTFTTLTTNYTKNGTTTPAVAADWGTLYEGSTISGKITACTLATGRVLLVR
jgi:hypothetical protein